LETFHIRLQSFPEKPITKRDDRVILYLLIPYCQIASPLNKLVAMSILPYRHFANNFAIGEMTKQDVANLPHFL
jgi:hypothetical protein